MGRPGNAGYRGARGTNCLGNGGGVAECGLPVPATTPSPSVMTHAHTAPSSDTQSTTTKNWQPTRMKTSELDAKRPTRIPQPQQVNLPDDIGKYVVCDADEVT